MKTAVETDESKDEKEDDLRNPMQKLEHALVTCEFGVFNLRLMITTLIATCASTTVTTTSSYILSIAECDLNMTILQKGLLNAMPFFGQVGASLFTGFLIDAFGRKVFLVSGHVGMFICTVLQGSSQTYWMMMIFKLIDGMCLSITFSGIAVMVSELTHKNVRDRVLLVYAACMSTSIIVVALVSWGILIQTWDLVIVQGYFELHSWNIYLYVSSVWSLVAAILYYCLPESPKYLLSQGQEEEALEILKNIFRENTRKPKEDFPIKSLSIKEANFIPKKRTFKTQLTNAFFETKDLFRRPLICQLLLFSCATFVCLLAYSAQRLWYPQLSTIIENYQLDHNKTDRFCVMMNDYTSSLVANVTESDELTVTKTCVPKLSGSETYINGIIMGVVSLICVSVSAGLVNYFGQKPLMFVALVLCAVCSGSMYWTNSSIQIALLVSLTCAMMQTSLSLQQNILVRVFPTTVRTMALSVILMAGRTGSLVGNVLFPVMLEAGCMGPFLALTVITLGVAALIYFFPNPAKENKTTGDK